MAGLPIDTLADQPGANLVWSQATGGRTAWQLPDPALFATAGSRYHRYSAQTAIHRWGHRPIETARDHKPPLILASASPRRRQLLSEAGYGFEVVASGVEEPPPPAEISPSAYAAQLAWRKAAEVARRRSSGLILAADTVCCVVGEILNKPRDRADAERMIRLQEGRDTEVISGICLYRAGRDEWIGAIELSVVRFRNLDDAEREAYLDSRRWEGKSGAYGVQDRDPWVSVVSGSFSNVVGLPMERLADLLERYRL
jgi:septum formation protein